MINFIFPLFGRFHPILVHLPIGFLAFGVILVFLSRRDTKEYLSAIRLSFLLGGIFATLSSVSGFFQYQYEGFTWDTVQFHFIFGWITVISSFGLFYQINRFNDFPKHFQIKAGVLFVILLFTGHLGGNITHGEEYLTEVLPPELQSMMGIEVNQEEELIIPEQGWEQLAYYDQVVQPILNQNCRSCHNPRNKKGELDLSTYETLLEGGENGAVLTGNSLENSPVFSRLILPKEDEDHMPPKEKRQPIEEEIELIKSWVELGGNLDSKLGDADITSETLEPFFYHEEKPFYPVDEIEPASPETLSQLKSEGFFAETVSEESNWLIISCLNFQGFEDADWKKLKTVQNQIVSLDLTGTKISDAIIDSVKTLPNLTVLKLNQTEISGANLSLLKENTHLKNLFLNKTKVTLEEIKSLEGHPGLEKVFAFDTPASESDFQQKFNFYLGIKKYELPPLPTDTIVY
ncbi:c-type cytochrome domain-containing protein [Algoriphagus machipongonensis]|uniref:Cytochrome C Planctomycete-type domain-containing protein n=1 Tax=Algoriphagus machipongonensis TaxID=388413 RepID=A3I121_9BACT|nr:c-type cytochrome domain-containing protein [Algoriphagus machipongonensis]EAZ80167.1 hypothetical protein ALPR1_16099 [Algoriphagus machipongonensis]